jgi:hypothetical protein
MMSAVRAGLTLACGMGSLRGDGGALEQRGQPVGEECGSVMSSVFTRAFRVRWSETNAVGEVDITGYLRYLVETAWDWGAAGGLSLEECHAQGLAWVMRETQFNFFPGAALQRSLRVHDLAAGVAAGARHTGL